MPSCSECAECPVRQDHVHDLTTAGFMEIARGGEQLVCMVREHAAAFVERVVIPLRGIDSSGLLLRHPSLPESNYRLVLPVDGERIIYRIVDVAKQDVSLLVTSTIEN